MHRDALRKSRFPCKLPSPIGTSPIKKKGKELCRGVNISKETNYVKFHDSTVRHLSVQGINIKVLKKKVFKNGRYDAESRDQSQRSQHVIHNFFRKTKKTKSLKKFCEINNKEKKTLQKKIEFFSKIPQP